MSESDGDEVTKESSPIPRGRTESEVTRPGPRASEPSPAAESIAPDQPASSQSPRRRIEPRIAAAFRVRYDSINEVVTAYTRDVSSGGIYIYTTDFLPVGAVVRIHLALPDDGPEFQVVARVAYVLAEDEADDHKKRAGMGMEFLDLGGTPLANQLARYFAESVPELAVPPPPAGMSSKILVIDDDVWYRERAAQLMREAGHDVKTADNGVRGLSAALSFEPDLVLTDVQMPVMDGWQLVRMLRARPTLANTPVVFVTSLGSDEQRLQGYRLGVDDYISKPFNDELLALRIERVLDRARAYPRNIMGKKALRGSLRQVSMSSLLSYLDIEKRTGLLLLVQSDAIATLYLRDGAVMQVDLPEDADHLVGVDRLFHVLGWDKARFELAEAAVAELDSIGMSVTDALLAYAQRQKT